MSNATPKQLSYLSDLASALGKAVPSGLSAAQASALISQLQAEKAAAGPRLVGEGIYRRSSDGAMFRVQTSDEGRNYAKLLLPSGGWDYERGAVYTLKPEERLTLAEISAWGISTGVCAICGRLLSTAESVAAGIGPICAKGY
jgi:hypothetical protein